MTKKKALACPLCGGEMRFRKLGEYMDHICKKCWYTSPQTHASHFEETARKECRSQSRLIARYMVPRTEYGAEIWHRDAALSAVNEEVAALKARVAELETQNAAIRDVCSIEISARFKHEEYLSRICAAIGARADADDLVPRIRALKARLAALESAQPATTVTTPNGFTVTVTVRKGDA